MRCRDNGGMTETTADNRSEPIEPESPHTDSVDPSVVDPLDGIDAKLDGLADVDPAEAVAVLADITVELNKELDADTDRS